MAKVSIQVAKLSKQKTSAIRTTDATINAQKLVSGHIFFRTSSLPSTGCKNKVPVYTSTRNNTPISKVLSQLDIRKRICYAVPYAVTCHTTLGISMFSQ